ncbi:mas-related G-protein coupled receptor member H-like [Tiliqua scincoides]|uniref:mas-related G-protein coupled receptor member H-like n=1 Tax=Tiliqua scincoides TaxID=71010 RepID=UPI003462C74C
MASELNRLSQEGEHIEADRRIVAQPLWHSGYWSCLRKWHRVLRVSLLCAFTCLVCIFGLAGNGAVLWLLGFRMKRTPFSIYILNLAVADCGVLISSILMAIITIVRMHHLEQTHLYIFFYSSSQFLLTSISIDRCTSVLFPFWYRFRRPKTFSTVLCALIWLLTFLVQGICLTVYFTWSSYALFALFLGILVNAVVCLPPIMVSTLILFVRFCFKSQQRQRGKLIMVILLTLFFFLIFAFPLNIIYLIRFSDWSSLEDWLIVTCYNLPEFGLLLSSLNSFVNPLLYFLVGRKKRGLCRENLKLVLRRVFIEEEETCTEEPETQLGDL